MSIFIKSIGAALLVGAGSMASVEAAQLKVTIHNDAQIGGNFLTPLWVAFHNGSFDAFSAGAAASPGIEAIAEDGNPAPLSALFAGQGTSGVIGGGPLAPGASSSQVFEVAEGGANDFLSYAAMVLPSSDFFIGNDNPHAVSVAGVLDGSFGSLTVTVKRVFDAGTEVNDFATSAGNGLFGIAGGQSGPNQGATESGVVSIASGADYAAFLNGVGVNIGALNFSNLMSLATITVERAPAPVPLPAGLPLLGVALGLLGLKRQRRV